MAMVDQEKKFLESQRARVNTIERSQRLQHTDILHAFWAHLRQKLSIWESKLHHLQKVQGKQSAKHQQLQDLKIELQQIRKHCLGSTVCFDDWEVPDLPVADMRLLHNEFSKYFAMWEVAKEVISPKGKFTFRRYREEISRRKAQGIPLSAPLATQTSISPRPRVLHTGACLEGISNESIVIDADGNVLVRNEQIMNVSDAALLVRNLHHCSLVISKKLVTLHIVETSETEITLEEPARAIHITDCQACSLNACAQQLRLHKSADLICTVEVTAGAILEDCTRLTFCSDAIDVKDFNWLRSGVPSPNFNIKSPSTNSRLEELSAMTLDEKEAQRNESDMNKLAFEESQNSKTLEIEAPNNAVCHVEVDDDDDEL